MRRRIIVCSLMIATKKEYNERKPACQALKDTTQAGVEWRSVATRTTRLWRGEGLQAKGEVDSLLRARAKGLINIAERDLVVVELMGDRERVEVELVGDVVVGTIANQARATIENRGG